MANKPTLINFSSERLQTVLDGAGISFYALCMYLQNKGVISERRLRDNKKTGRISASVLDEIGQYLDVSPDYLSGKVDEVKYASYYAEDIQQPIYKSFIPPYQFYAADKTEWDAIAALASLTGFRNLYEELSEEERLKLNDEIWYEVRQIFRGYISEADIKKEAELIAKLKEETEQHNLQNQESEER